MENPDRAVSVSDAVRVTPSERRAQWRPRAQAALGGPLAEAAGLAVGQGFVLTWPQAQARGASRADVRRMLHRGVWSRPRHAVLAVLPLTGDTRSVLTATAAALVYPGSTVAGLSAAAVLGLPLLAVPSRPELTGDKSIRRPDLLMSPAALDDTQRFLWRGIPLTSPARTLVDLGRTDRRQALVAADAALRDGLVTNVEIEAALARAAGRRRVAQADEILRLATPAAESPLESLTRLVLHDAGLPAPRPQAVIAADDFYARVDLLFDDYGVIVEADGRLKYAAQDDALWREKLRQERLERMGFVVVRVTWDDVTRTPRRTVERVRDALHRGTRLPTRTVA